MNKLLALLLALMLMLSLAACGGSGGASNTPTPTATEQKVEVQTQDDEEDYEEEAYDEEAYEEEDASDASAAQSGGLTSLADEFSLAYMGVTEAGETIYFALSNDESFAVLMFYDISTNSNVSFVGPASAEGTAVTVQDVKNGLQFTFIVEAAQDGGVLVDTGDSGMAVMAECSIIEVLEAIEAIEDYSDTIG